jgi:hypothetical protein
VSAKIAGLQAVKFWHVRSDRPEMFEDPSGQWVAASDYDQLAELCTRNVAYTEGILGQLGRANKRVELLQSVCADLRELVKIGGRLATHANGCGMVNGGKCTCGADRLFANASRTEERIQTQQENQTNER